MKKIKIFIITLLVIISFAFMPPTIKASEVTTEITTEEAVTTGSTGETIDLVDTLEKAKTWIVGVILYIVSQGFTTTVTSYFLRKAEKKAFGAIDEAVAQNKISQATADATKKIVHDGIVAVEIKVNDMKHNVTEKIDDMNDNVKELMDKLDSKFLSLFNLAIQEYLENDSEEETVAETEDPEEVWNYG